MNLENSIVLGNKKHKNLIERILPSGNSKKNKEVKGSFNINKALKRVDKIENPKEKVKYLYGLILKFMCAKGMDIKKSYSIG